MNNKSLAWKEFDERRERFFSDRGVLTKLKLASFAVELPEHISEAVLNSQRERNKKFKGVLDLIEKLQIELQILNDQMHGGTKRFSDCLAELVYELEIEMGLHVKSPKGKTGPRSYPQFLKQWIFETIELAKNDREKLMFLADFFYPRGEFDNWLQEQTNGLLQEPSAKYHEDEKEIEKAFGKDWDRRLQWLRDQKAICKIDPKHL